MQFHFLTNYAGIQKDSRKDIVDEGPDWVRVKHQGGLLVVSKSYGYTVRPETKSREENRPFARFFGGRR